MLSSLSFGNIILDLIFYPILILILIRLGTFIYFMTWVIFGDHRGEFEEAKEQPRMGYEEILKTCKCIPYDESKEYYDDSDYEEDIIFEDDLALYYENTRKKKKS